MKGELTVRKWVKQVFLMLLVSGMVLRVSAQDYTVTSPDGELEIRLTLGEQLSYSVYKNDFEAIAPSVIGMSFDNGRSIGVEDQVVNSETRSVNETIYPEHSKNKEIKDQFNELTLSFEGDYQMIIRAYDEGVAYRFVTAFDGEVVVESEAVNFNFSGETSVIFPEADAQMRSWERAYTRYNSRTEIASNKFSITPTMFTYSNNLRVVVAEADQFDYPGLYIQHNDQGGMKGKWALYPREVSDSSNIYAYHRVVSRETFIAKTDGARNYPWRVVIVEDDDKMLLNNQLIYKLATPSVLENTDWVKPGKSAWEWWHDAILETNAIPSGPGNLSFELYKYYVDLAADYNLEYITMDAGWSTDFASQVIQYAKGKGVDVILWDFINLPVENPARLLELKSLGAAGVKVDLIERDDQEAMRWVEQLARNCAKQKMVLVLHGCPRPSGWERTFPNIVNYEAVRGAECTKWDYTANPDYHLEFPFIRMLSGPLDYTPGSMRNRHMDKFQPIPHGVPNTMGTRVHELAMYVLFDQPVAYLCDSPIEYRKYPDIMRFFEHVPTVWDQTVPLAAEVGEYAIVAKQSGSEWYVGAMTNKQSREVEIDFSFLDGNQKRTAAVWVDSDQTEFIATAYESKTISVDNSSKVKFQLAKGGGLVIRVYDQLILGTESETLNEDNGATVWLDNNGSRINVKSDKTIDECRIFDLSGKTVKKNISIQPARTFSYDLSGLKDGIYILEMVGKNYRDSTKFYKKTK